MKKIVIIPLIIILFSGCGISAKKTAQRKKLYFDIPAYIGSEINILKQESLILEKTIDLNGEKETKQYTSNDSTDLSVFKEVDLNKLAYEGKFKVDSIITDSNNFKITYTATDVKMQIRSCIISNSDIPGRPCLYIELRDDNRLYTTTKKLSYYPEKEFSIEVTQKAQLHKQNYYTIRVQMRSQ